MCLVTLPLCFVLFSDFVCTVPTLLLNTNQTMAPKVKSSGEKKIEIKRMLGLWQELSDFVEKNHPDKLVSGRAGDFYNDSCLSHFRAVLKRRQRQVSLDRYFNKIERPRESDSEAKRAKSDSDEHSDSEAKKAKPESEVSCSEV